MLGCFTHETAFGGCAVRSLVAISCVQHVGAKACHKSTKYTSALSLARCSALACRHQPRVERQLKHVRALTKPLLFSLSLSLSLCLSLSLSLSLCLLFFSPLSPLSFYHEHSCAHIQTDTVLTNLVISPQQTGLASAITHTLLSNHADLVYVCCYVHFRYVHNVCVCIILCI